MGETEFDEEGRLVRKVEEGSADGRSMEHVYEYDNEGELMRETTYVVEKDGKKWMKSEKIRDENVARGIPGEREYIYQEYNKDGEPIRDSEFEPR